MVIKWVVSRPIRKPDIARLVIASMGGAIAQISKKNPLSIGSEGFIVSLPGLTEHHLIDHPAPFQQTHLRNEHRAGHI